MLKCDSKRCVNRFFSTVIKMKTKASVRLICHLKASFHLKWQISLLHFCRCILLWFKTNKKEIEVQWLFSNLHYSQSIQSFDVYSCQYFNPFHSFLSLHLLIQIQIALFKCNNIARKRHSSPHSRSTGNVWLFLQMIDFNKLLSITNAESITSTFWKKISGSILI